MAAQVRCIFSRCAAKIPFRCSPTPRAFSSKEIKSEKNDETTDDLDKPIKFSTSKAATWKAESSFAGSEKVDVTPWYQPTVISLSLAAFLLYFGILREENDIDKQLGMTLYDRIDGLEEVQLKTAIKYYKENDSSYDIGPMERRLAEIHASKNSG